jgi:uncharacterized protein
MAPNALSPAKKTAAPLGSSFQSFSDNAFVPFPDPNSQSWRVAPISIIQEPAQSPAGVFLGGVLMSWAAGGSAGLRDLGRRIFNPRLVGWRWWLVILFFFPAVALLSAGVSYLAGISPQPFDFSEALHLLANPIQLLTFALFVLIIGPLPEEIGWRGFLLDRLQLRWNALTASLVLAVVWASWHIPLFFLPGYYEAFGSAPPTLFNLFIGIVSVVLLYTWVYNNTHRSILGVIVFHFMQNFTGEMMSLSDEARLVRTILTVVISILVLWHWGHKTMRKKDRINLSLIDAAC